MVAGDTPATTEDVSKAMRGRIARRAGWALPTPKAFASDALRAKAIADVSTGESELLPSRPRPRI
ncbi:MAG: hypothetical protein DME48_14660 [Verrucomicrobia bacterium]|nr:MAG: hypothetical protein DME48_14660 [Verrucomicrobiota bacterium]